MSEKGFDTSIDLARAQVGVEIQLLANGHVDRTKASTTGVPIGPLIATLVSRMDSNTWGGKGVPYFSITSTPASTGIHSNPTPVASKTVVIALATSGPMPSPGIKVTR
jgi:hypothetical protein